ncbi:hypothetical protein VZT92_021694 [Zoarces viviparus]|uniref:Uncharacterized protein n=1 Tax=Zoarces viviparus TaxID=48416 RepID=A0AAW1E9Q4_ZOAVI
MSALGEKKRPNSVVFSLFDTMVVMEKGKEVFLRWCLRGFGHSTSDLTGTERTGCHAPTGLMPVTRPRYDLTASVALGCSCDG